MNNAFITRPPTENDIAHIRMLMSVFGDGFGNQRDGSNGTRADWRQLERCIGEFVGSSGGEDKKIFDVLAPNESGMPIYYGLSVKSKQLPTRSFTSLSNSGRVYMEIANSPAKFWDVIREKLELSEADFRSQRHPKEIGNLILSTIEDWHYAGKVEFESNNPGKTLDIEKSCYFCISLGAPVRSTETPYQVHTFSLKYPKDLLWRYRSDKCLSGFDPTLPDQAVIDWYALSGGQLKYYPQAKISLFSSPPFTLLKPKIRSISDRAKEYFPDLAKQLGL